MMNNIQPDNNEMFQESEAVKDRKVELEKLRRRSLATSHGKLIHSNRRRHALGGLLLLSLSLLSLLLVLFL